MDPEMKANTAPPNKLGMGGQGGSRNEDCKEGHGQNTDIAHGNCGRQLAPDPVTAKAQIQVNNIYLLGEVV